MTKLQLMLFASLILGTTSRTTTIPTTSRTNTTSDFCRQGKGEVMYLAPLVVLARAKAVRVREGRTEVVVKVGQVWRQEEGGGVVARDRVVVVLEEVCRRVRRGRRYVFSLLPEATGGWRAAGAPLTPTSRCGMVLSMSSRVQRLRRKLLCPSCEPAPALRHLPHSLGVTAGR